MFLFKREIKQRQQEKYFIYLKNGPIPASFVYFRLYKQTLQFLQQTNVKKMSIQYMALGFELTTFGIQVSSHNH